MMKSTTTPTSSAEETRCSVHAAALTPAVQDPSPQHAPPASEDARETRHVLPADTSTDAYFPSPPQSHTTAPDASGTPASSNDAAGRTASMSGTSRPTTTHSSDTLRASEADMASAAPADRDCELALAADDEADPDCVDATGGHHGRNVYIAALPLTFTVRDLRALLEPFGEVRSLRMFNSGERVAEIGRAYGFALFEDDACAEAAVAALNGARHGDARLQCMLSRNAVVKRPRRGQGGSKGSHHSGTPADVSAIPVPPEAPSLAVTVGVNRASAAQASTAPTATNAPPQPQPADSAAYPPHPYGAFGAYGAVAAVVPTAYPPQPFGPLPGTQHFVPQAHPAGPFPLPYHPHQHSYPPFNHYHAPAAAMYAPQYHVYGAPPAPAHPYATYAAVPHAVAPPPATLVPSGGAWPPPPSSS